MIYDKDINLLDVCLFYSFTAIYALSQTTNKAGLNPNGNNENKQTINKENAQNKINNCDLNAEPAGANGA